MPEVVNRHALRERWPAECMYIGRHTTLWEQIQNQQMHCVDGTALGNPYTLKNSGDPLRSYRGWLWRKIQANDPGVLAALDSITEDTNLVCSCKPAPCHGDVVLRCWQWRRKEQAA